MFPHSKHWFKNKIYFQESLVKFHIVGLKCIQCGSYNTTRIKGSGVNSDNPSDGENLAAGGPRLPPLPTPNPSAQSNGTTNSTGSRQLSTAEFALAILARSPHVPRLFAQPEPTVEELANEYYDSDNSSNQEREQNEHNEENVNSNTNDTGP